MSHRRTRGTGIAFGQSLWRGIATVAGVVLIGLVSSVPSASALLREAAGTVGSTVRSVQATANTPPSLPSLPRATPPVPRATPPATPAAPQAPGQLPTGTTPMPSPSSAGSGGDLPAADGIAGATRNSVGSVTGTRGETATQAAPSASDGDRASVLPSGPTGISKTTPRAIGTASSAPPSVSDAEVAALQRWFARVWPAIGLGGEAGRDLVVRLIEGDLFRPVVVVMTRLLSLVPPTIQAAAVQAAADSPPVRGPSLARHPVTGNEVPQLALPDVPAVPLDEEQTLYLIAFVALLASLVFMLRGEFRSTFRAGVRRWHRLRSR
jgi:hypothetical protein